MVHAHQLRGMRPAQKSVCSVGDATSIRVFQIPLTEQIYQRLLMGTSISCCSGLTRFPQGGNYQFCIDKPLCNHSWHWGGIAEMGELLLLEREHRAGFGERSRALPLDCLITHCATSSLLPRRLAFAGAAAMVV